MTTSIQILNTRMDRKQLTGGKEKKPSTYITSAGKKGTVKVAELL